MSLLCIVPPPNEPVSLSEMCQHLREVPMDSASPEGLELLAMIAAARATVESYCRRVLVMQSWELTEHRHHRLWRRLEDRLQRVHRVDHGIRLPYAPLLAVDLVQYSADDGTTQIATYRVDRGSRTQPGTLWLTEQCEVPEQFRDGFLTVQWRDGYGGMVSGLTLVGSVVSGYAFTSGDVGTPFAFQDGTVSRVLSVDDSGNATLAVVPQAAPSAAFDAYLGWTIPPQITHAIKKLAADLYANRETAEVGVPLGGGTDVMPVALQRLLRPYCNWLS